MLTIRESLVVIVETFYSAVIELVLGDGQEHLLVLIAGCHIVRSVVWQENRGAAQHLGRSLLKAPRWVGGPILGPSLRQGLGW